MNPEIIWLGHNNPNHLVLKSDGEAVELSSIVRMTLTMGSVLVDSDNGDADPIRWSKDGYETGEVRMYLGAQSLTPGRCSGVLIVYDLVNTDGIVWGRIPFIVYAEVEAAAP